MGATPRDLDDLLAHAGWARALARNLVRDPAGADDLMQRAWLAALRRPPADGTPPRRWLAAVLRNFARQDAREASRREQRENAVARSERAIGPDPLEDAAALQVRLITAVRELPEPSRSTVWARYYEGLAPREIAARDGVPVDTVKTRLARGLESLRKRFDREHGGDRGAWIAALLPVAFPDPFSISTIGAFLMGAKVKVAVAVALVCSAATWFTVARNEVEPPSALAQSSAPIEPNLDRAPERESVLAIASDSAARAPIAVAATVDDHGDGGVHEVRGRVLDLEGRPVEGLEIGRAKRDFPSSVRSAADGSFAITREFAGHALEASGPGWATVWVDRIPRVGSDRRVTILATRAGQLAGTVVDHLGQPVASATIDVEVDESVLRAVNDLVDADPHQLGYTAFSDVDGRFDLGDVPLVSGTIRASAEGRDTQALPIPDGARADLVLVLDGPGVDDVVVRGTVGSAPEMRIRGAYVRVGNATQRTDHEGNFALIVRPADLLHVDPLELVAVSENQLPTRVAFPSQAELRRRAAQETFDLVLGEDPLQIRGRVVDAAGNRIVGARVRADEERFGTVTADVRNEPVRRDLTVEEIVRNAPHSEDRPAESDGTFTLRGLQDREYRLVVTCRDPLAACVVHAVRAGTDELVVVLDTRGPTQRVAGRVVDDVGRPLTGVNVAATVDFGAGIGLQGSRAVVTDAAGAFELQDLRGRIVTVSADVGSHWVGVDVERDSTLEDVRIVVPRRSAIQIDIRSQPELATDFEVRNARGRVGLHSSRTVAGRTVTKGWERVAVSLPIHDDRSDVVGVDGRELTAVLLRHGQEVARIPIVLAPEGLTVVRP